MNVYGQKSDYAKLKTIKNAATDLINKCYKNGVLVGGDARGLGMSQSSEVATHIEYNNKN